jgi:hypothetical protein
VERTSEEDKMFVMRKGDVFRCQNPECRAEIEVRRDSVEGPLNPRCCCGAEMKKRYAKPVLTVLDKDKAGLAALFGR